MVFRPAARGARYPGLPAELVSVGRRAQALLPSTPMRVPDTDDYAGDQPQGPGPDDEERVKRPTRRRPRRRARQ
jgi:hypothetical protein